MSNLIDFVHQNTARDLTEMDFFKSGDTVAVSYRIIEGSKERIQIFAQGRILELDNFRTLRGYGWNGFSKMVLWQQDKGQKNCVGAFLDAVNAVGEFPIPLSEIFDVSRICIEIANSDTGAVCSL